MPVRILTDEHVAVDISHDLMGLGFDVVSVRDRNLLEAEDWDLMRWCRDHGYAICTKNRRDFERQHEHHQNRGEEHPGILILEGEWDPDEIYWALLQYLETVPTPQSLRSRVYRLPPATAELIESHPR